MKQCSCKLTVLFQDTFWVGIFEDECEVERIKKRKEIKELERDRMYGLKQIKKKEKHKGH